MNWYEEEVQALERQHSLRPRIPHPVVFYGSSTFRLWTNLALDLADSRALNLSFGGSTLEACAYFFDRLVPPEQPSSVVIYAGDNDLGDGQNPERVLSSFQALAGRIEHALPGIPFTFISIKPSPARFHIVDRILRTNELIQEEISQHSCARYISVFEAMMKDGKPRADLFLEDGLHLGPAGYRLWTELLGKHRNTIFTQGSDGCNPETLSSGKIDPRISQMVQPRIEP